MEQRALDDQELFTTRVIEAEPGKIFAAISDPVRLAKWWGPEGFTNTFTQFEFRPGGTWHYTMHSANGANFINLSEFAEIVPSERIVIDHISPPEFRLTITLESAGERTLVGWRQRFPSPEDCLKVSAFAPRANEENLDRLEAHLAGTI